MKLKLFESAFMALATVLIFSTCLMGLGFTLKLAWLLLKFGWTTL